MRGNSAAGATSGDGSVTLIAADNSHAFKHLVLSNLGAASGFWSIDGGNTWLPLPAATTLTLNFFANNIGATLANGVKIKRIASGTDLSAVWGIVL